MQVPEQALSQQTLSRLHVRPVSHSAVTLQVSPFLSLTVIVSSPPPSGTSAATSLGRSGRRVSCATSRAPSCASPAPPSRSGRNFGIVLHWPSSHCMPPEQDCAPAQLAASLSRTATVCP